MMLGNMHNNRDINDEQTFDGNQVLIKTII